MTDNTQPEALRLAVAIKASGQFTNLHTLDEASAELLRQHARIAELEARLEAVGAGDVQALSAAPAGRKLVPVESTRSMMAAAVIFVNGNVVYKNVSATALEIEESIYGEAYSAMLAASPTPPAPAEQQAAPKAAPGVGNSGFDHKTAADILNGKTVSDEAVRKFVAVSRWAHDERAALSATLLAMHGVLASREAEIALLKKALLEAEAAPAPNLAKALNQKTLQNDSLHTRSEHDNT